MGPYPSLLQETCDGDSLKIDIPGCTQQCRDSKQYLLHPQHSIPVAHWH